MTEKLFEAAAPALSATRMVNANVPGVWGVPRKTPVEASRVRPPVSPVADHV